MANSYFQFKQFTIQQDKTSMKVTTDACLFGAYTANKIESRKSKIESVLDVGAGTGLLALMIRQKNPSLTIDGIELDNDASDQAKENVNASPWKDLINIIHADARQYTFDKKYDCIVSNPPFYENELKSGVEKKNIAHHSQALTLNDLFTIIKQNLEVQGIFYLLLPYKRAEEIKDLLNKHHLALKEILFVRQSVNHDYFRIILEGCHKKEGIETKIDEISIWDDRQQYTAEFTALLKDYYLYL